MLSLKKLETPALGFERWSLAGCPIHLFTRGRKCRGVVPGNHSACPLLVASLLKMLDTGAKEFQSCCVIDSVASRTIIGARRAIARTHTVSARV